MLALSLIAALGWLAAMPLLYDLTRSPGELWGMRSEWNFLRDWIGLPTFITIALLIAALIRHERHFLTTLKD